MTSKGRISRRSLLKGSAVAAAGATTGAFAQGALADEELPDVVTASSLGTIESTRPDGTLEIRRWAGSRHLDLTDPSRLVEREGRAVLDQPTDSTVVTRDPTPVEPRAPVWKPGHEVVLIEEYKDGEWTITDVQHLFRAIEEGTVVELRPGGVIITDSQELRVTAQSVERGAGGEVRSIPPSQIDQGDVVAGLGYLEPDGHRVAIAQLDLRRADR